MSTITEDDYNENTEVVIIRGFRDRPAKLKSLKTRARSIDVVGVGPGQPIMAFHLERAYEYSESLFRQLCRAFESGDNSLPHLWEKAAKFGSRS